MELNKYGLFLIDTEGGDNFTVQKTKSRIGEEEVEDNIIFVVGKDEDSSNTNEKVLILPMDEAEKLIQALEYLVHGKSMLV